MIKMIVCTDLLGNIGYRNDLLYNISDDLKRFKKLTEGQIILMGKNTLHSLPNQYLPNRTNVVLTKNEKYKPKNSGVIVMHDYEAIINQAKSGNIDKDVIIIGGKSLYQECPTYVDVIHLTRVLDESDRADVSIDLNKILGKEYEDNDYKTLYTVYKTETKLDEKTGLMYQFIDYVKTSKLQEYHLLEMEKLNGDSIK